MRLAAIIIETRDVPNLSNIINDHLDRLPPYTHIYIYLGKASAYEALELNIRECDVDYTLIYEPFDLTSYNKLLTSPEFWKQYDHCDRVLIFQSDSKILSKDSYVINKFYGWSYVGAPWKFQNWGGNGGFSLRDPKIMLEICNKYKWDGYMNEDIYFCNTMDKFKIGKLAPNEVCKKFSCESIFELGTFGCHAIEAWLTPEQCNLIYTQYD